MTAVRRLLMGFRGVALAAVLVSPALAQNAEAPVDVTAAPPPTADSVGPTQLRNFSLGGQTSRPTATPTPQTAPTPRPSIAPPTTSSAAPPGNRASELGPSNTSPRTSASTAPTVSAPDTQSTSPSAERPELTPPEPAAVAPAADVTPNVPDVATSTGSSMSLMPWIAALIAALAGAAALWWMRQKRQHRLDDPGRLAFAGPQPEVDAAPRRAPVPAPVPAPAPAPSPSPAPRPTPPAADGGRIVSRSLKPSIIIEFQPDRLLVSDKEIAVQFDMVVRNGGSAPARDVLIEARMFTAHAGQDDEIARYFYQPRSQGDRIAAIPPLGRVALKSVVRLPIDDVQKFKVDERELFVPLVAFNVLFQSAAGEGQSSASFMVGRGTGDDAKLAPFAVEKGPRIHNGLSARQHSTGLNR